MKKRKVIKDPVKLTEVLNSLRPMSARLFLHLLLTQKPGVRFNYTLYNMQQEGKVKNAQQAIADILDKGYIARRRIGSGSYQYTILIDIIE